MPPTQRPIKRILIANRGEIAIRILQACRELPDAPLTYGIYNDNDTTHISLGRPDKHIKIPSAASYMDITYLVDVVKQHEIDAVHPGYGFLSESAEFSRRMWEEADCMVVGPGWEVLERTGDKLKAKKIAEECGVPVLKAMTNASGSAADVERFADQVGYPIMIKAVDGGGGRGIRLVRSKDELQSAVQRCVSESASRMIFAEQAAVDGYKHIEVQIIGDGRGSVRHLWERDCSVQRRFQKIVEIAPSPVPKRRIIAMVIDSAIRMARSLKYLGLGTFEYLVNVKQRKFFFLEINPRLQVEHTISECITGVDLVKEQLLIAQGQQNSDDLRTGEWWEAKTAPKSCSIQLRLCAEDLNSNFALSIGKVTDVNFPSGNGIRIDSHLSKGGVVGSDFDNLMAKIIVTSSTWEDTLLKATRALNETSVTGVKTNLNLLRAILSDKAFQMGLADTKWLENNMEKLIESGNAIGKAIESATADLPNLPSATGQSSVAQSSIAFRKGDAWSLNLEGAGQVTKEAAHHLSINRVIRNEFPEAFVADVSFTVPGSQPQAYKATLSSTSASAEATSSQHRRGDVNNKSHIILPMSGKLVELLVQEGDEVRENEVIAFVKQMKMELEVRSPRAGTIGWVIELENEEGDDVAEGVLLAELQPEQGSRPDLKSRL